MIILVINSGSSSLKFQLLNMDTREVMAKGLIEKISLKDSVFSLKFKEQKVTHVLPLSNHEQSIELMLNSLIQYKDIGLTSLDQIDAVGHRVVQGGDSFDKAVLINDRVNETIASYSVMAPLHNPAHLAGIKACCRNMPNTPQVAVFDTAFYQGMDPVAYTYGLPKHLADKYRIRRYGAHGTSHKYVSKTAANTLGIPLEELKMITCHLGNGSSITAIQNGKAIDTSMGFTPHEGLLMGTRCGDIDATAVLYLMQQEYINIMEMEHLLNKESGLLGISGISSDMRDIEKAIDDGNSRAKLARDIFIQRVKKYIGSYIAIMNGADVLVFTAGIGENSASVRRDICANMDFLGIDIDQEKNMVHGKIAEITGQNSRIRVLVIPTDEEMAIAEETIQAVFGGYACPTNACPLQ